MCLHGPPHVSVSAFVDTLIFVLVCLKDHPSGFGCFDSSPENHVFFVPPLAVLKHWYTTVYSNTP